MSSPSRPIPSSARPDVAFWLPPGGIDNGVYATYWTQLADLDSNDIGPVLKLVTDAGVGGYAAIPSGQRHHRDRLTTYRLWADSLQYHRAEDVLMAYFNKRC